MIRKIAIAFAVVFALVLAAAFAFQKPIGMALFDRAAERNLGRDSLASLGDGLHIGLCGTGSPLPNPDRAGACNLVVAGKHVLLVDAGEGAARNLALMGVNQGDIEMVLLTHFHSDHIDGLGPLALMHWVRGAATAPLPLVAPEGVEPIASGFNQAYRTDNLYRTAHHGEKIAPPTGGGYTARPFTMAGASKQIYAKDGLTITAFKVDHDPVRPAVGYRFDYKGRSACISGDTKRSANLESVCKGVDLLVHEALQPRMIKKMQAMLANQGNARAAKIMHDIIGYHSSPEDAAKSAQAAGASELVLTHLVPPLPTHYLYAAFLGDAPRYFDGPIIVGEDGMLFSLGPQDKAIEARELM